MAERVQMYGRRLTAQQKERRQDNGDKKMTCVSPPEQFISLADPQTDRQRTARCRLASASSFAISNIQGKFNYSTQDAKTSQ